MGFGQKEFKTEVEETLQAYDVSRKCFSDLSLLPVMEKYFILSLPDFWIILQLIVWAPTREQAIDRMKRALNDTVITGLPAIPV